MAPRRTPVSPRPTHHRRPARLLAATLAGVLAPASHATEAVSGDALLATFAAPRVDVIGAMENLPLLGSTAHTISSEDLRNSQVFTTGEALRKVPGVHVRDEEGFGLRPNIGIRGLNPTRSTKVLLLEDGIPLSYSPYGDNASYYHPSIDRYERIEVLKGAETMRFGPQTIAGVVNYITPNPPQQFGGYVQGVFGNRDYLNGKVNIGGNGFLLDLTHKEGAGARQNNQHSIDDLNLKWVGQLSDRQAITLRANYYKENSQVTYSGLTENEFRNFGGRYNPFRNDNFDAERFGLSATHDLELAGGALLTTNVYAAYFTRDWYRQSSNSVDKQDYKYLDVGMNMDVPVNPTGCADLVAKRRRGERIDPEDCRGNQGRLRDYITYGIEPRLVAPNRLGELQIGLKAHFEEQKRTQRNFAAPTPQGDFTDSERVTRRLDAYSGYLAQRFDVGDFSLTPIARYEWIDFDQNRTAGTATQIGRASDKTTAFTPGLAAAWNGIKGWTLFSGVHEGYAPPRIEDAISGSGFNNVDAERSTNFELGLRGKPTEGASLQAAYFRNDFRNLAALGNSGGVSATAQGEALFQGIELSGLAQLGGGYFGRLAYTWLPTARQDSVFRRTGAPADGNTGVAAAGSAEGNRLPYAPRHTATAALGYASGPFRFELEAQYVGAQYSDFAETRAAGGADTNAAGSDGRSGLIDSYTVVNLATSYKLDRKTTLLLTAKNLFDREYIVDRTRGILVGVPLLVQAGLRYDF
ncbi:MAG: TonB-dependent receptor [Rhodocyclaceae bacterium]|nr:TonB-dependent receptor [Rhodocyclaceae bacterium]